MAGALGPEGGGCDVTLADGCSNAARGSGVALGRVIGVHGLHGGDILQLDWCGPCRLYAVVGAG